MLRWAWAGIWDQLGNIEVGLLPVSPCVTVLGPSHDLRGDKGKEHLLNGKQLPHSHPALGCPHALGVGRADTV